MRHKYVLFGIDPDDCVASQAISGRSLTGLDQFHRLVLRALSRCVWLSPGYGVRSRASPIIVSNLLANSYTNFRVTAPIGE